MGNSLKPPCMQKRINWKELLQPNEIVYLDNLFNSAAGPDGKMNRDEFICLYRRMNPNKNCQQEIDQAFLMADQNRDGLITREEFYASYVLSKPKHQHLKEQYLQYYYQQPNQGVNYQIQPGHYHQSQQQIQYIEQPIMQPQVQYIEQPMMQTQVQYIEQPMMQPQITLPPAPLVQEQYVYVKQNTAPIYHREHSHHNSTHSLSHRGSTHSLHRQGSFHDLAHHGSRHGSRHGSTHSLRHQDLSIHGSRPHHCVHDDDDDDYDSYHRHRHSSRHGSTHSLSRHGSTHNLSRQGSLYNIKDLRDHSTHSLSRHGSANIQPSKSNPDLYRSSVKINVTPQYEPQDIQLPKPAVRSVTKETYYERDTTRTETSRHFIPGIYPRLPSPTQTN